MNYLGPIESAGPNGTMIILYPKAHLDLDLAGPGMQQSGEGGDQGHLVALPCNYQSQVSCP